MQIFPAIDLRGGQVVRLYQGDYDQETVYGADPCAQARAFLDAGARCLHVVDLDGARDGSLENFDSIAAIARQGGLFIEAGGGIRTEERIRRYLDLGVGRCILGTAAVKDFAFTARMAKKYGDQIAVGVDARDGYVAVNGWKELSREKGVDFCRRLRDAGVRAVIYTDISRDGAGRGTNLELYGELVQIQGLEITASGGVSSLEELRRLEGMGVRAAILGKALYTGRLDLRTVLEEVGAC
nr:1-(5-phosphoribosyl)-5-[(5-phosphoribosylamino)methylideneamino]imidazole-4-carboxamide isomerase [uncultured Oscillibacter sp.]